MKIRKLIITLIAFALPVGLLAQDLELKDVAGRGKVGTTGMQFLKIGVSARAVGMGEAFVALANDASAVYYNPAGLTASTKKAVMLTHIDWPADINYEFGAAVLPLEGIGVVAAYLGVLSTGDMKITVPYQGWTGGYFNASDWVVGLAFARRLTDKFSIGGSVKYITEFLGDARANNFAVDVGTLFNIGAQGLKLGMNVTNFGLEAKYHRDQFSLPINFRLGAIVDVYRSERNTVIATLEGSHPNDNVEQLAFGFEYNFKGLFALRSGYRTNIELEPLDKVDEPFEGFAFGAGARLSLSKVKTHLDYAYKDLGFLDNTQRFSLTFEF